MVLKITSVSSVSSVSELATEKCTGERRATHRVYKPARALTNAEDEQ